MKFYTFSVLAAALIITACESPKIESSANSQPVAAGGSNVDETATPKNNMPVFLDVVMDAGGKVKYMAHIDAYKYCADQENHLPSARELGQFAMSMGAKGIVGACGSSEPKCYRINATNADGSQDSFSFSWAGYQRPTGELGDGLFWWSSSVLSVDPDVAFYLDSYNGSIRVASRSTNYPAVRCVSGR